MSLSAEKLRKAVLTLPQKERAKLAQALLHTLDGPPDSDADSAWVEEIKRRAKELNDGRVKPVAWEVARKRIVRRLRERSR